MNNKEPVSLRVVIAARGEVEIESCLKALSVNISRVDMPVTIHISHDANIDADIIRKHFPSTPLNPEFLSSSKCRIVTTQRPASTSILKLWGHALALTDEQYAAVLDAQCPPAQDWLLTVARNIENAIPVFYGSVEPGWELADRNLVGYITEYAQFKSPVLCESEYPGNNIVFKTELLGDREELADKGFFKTFMLWKYEAEYKQKPRYADGMPVIYLKTFRFSSYMHRRKMHGRCFGATRLRQDNQPPRWACLAFTPVLFLLRTMRIYRWIKPRPDLARAFFHHFPSILVSEIAWSFGEFLGYGFGEGGACQYLD